MDEALVIDCECCPMRRTTTCDDCVVGVLLSRSGPADHEPAVLCPTTIGRRHEYRPSRWT
jgi:hypothetical protein